MPTIILDPTTAALAANPLSPAVAGPDPVQPAFSGIPQSTDLPDKMTVAGVFGEHPWDIEEKRARQALDEWRGGVLKTVDQAVDDPKQFFADVELPFAPDRESGKRLATNDLFMSWAAGTEDVPTGGLDRHLLRVKFSEEYFDGRGAETEDAFHTEVQAWRGKRKDRAELSKVLAEEAGKSAIADAVEPGRAGGWKATREKLKALPGWNHTTEADALDEYHAAARQARAAMAPYSAQLAQVWQAMNQGGAGTTSEVIKAGLSAPTVLGAVADMAAESTKRDAGATAFHLYQSIPEAQRPDFMNALGLLARTFPDATRTGFFANMAKQGGRDSDALGRGAAEAFLANAIGTMGAMPLSISTPGAGNLQQMTQPQADAARAEYMIRRNFAADVRRIEQQDFDPMKSAWSDGKPGGFESGLYGIPGTFSSTLPAAIPFVGFQLSYLAMQGQAYDQLRDQLRTAGMADKDASAFADRWAPLAAVPQAALEKLQAFAWTGKIPGVQKAMDAAGDLIKNRAMRLGARTAIGAAGETVIETAQDSFLYAAQDIGHALDKNVPDVQWEGPGGVMSDLWAQSGSTLISMLPLAIIGAAGGINREARARAFADAGSLPRLALGITPKDDAAIAAAADKGPATLARAVDQALLNSDGTSESAKAAIVQLEADHAAAQTIAEAAQSSGIVPVFRVNSDKSITVIDSGTGEEIGTADTNTDAVRIATADMGIKEESQAAVVAHLGGMLAAMQSRAKDGAAGHEVAFIYEPFNKTTAAEQIAASPESTARVWKQLGITEAMSPDRRDQVLKTSFVNGFSETEFRDGILATTNRILGTGTITTVFHEDTHGLRRVAMQRGTFTRDEQVAALRAIDAAMGKAGGTNAAKRFLSESKADSEISEEELDEAFAELMESEVLHTGLLGTKGTAATPGIVSRYFEAAFEASPFARVALSKLRGMARYLRAMYGEVFGRAVSIRRAIDKGHINEGEYQAMLAKLMGTDEAAQANAQALITAREIIEGVERVTYADGGAIDTPFSISHARQLDALVAKTLSLSNEPAFRAAWMARTAANLERLRRDRDRIKTAFGKDYTERALTEERTRKNIANEAAMRQALRRQELEDMAWGTHDAVLSQPELALLKHQPVHEAVSDPNNRLRGRIMSRGAAVKAGKYDPAQNGDYDGADGVNPTVFGGSNMPDQIAQELFDSHLIKEPTADALWDALRREQAGVANMRGYLKAARADVAKARVTARTETKAWEAAEIKRQGLDHSLHAKIVRAFGMLDGIIYALPPELRGKLGIHTATLAALKSDEARLAYLDKTITRASEEVEKWLKSESVAAIRKLFDRARPHKNKPGETRRGKIGADAHEIMTWAEEFAAMTAAQVEEKAASFDRSEVTLTDAGDDAGLLRLGVMRQTLDYAGGVFDKEARTVPEIVEAMGWLQRTYDFGRSEWQDKEAARMAEMEGLRQDVLAALLAQAGVEMPRLDLPKLDREALAKLPREQAERMLDEYAAQVDNRKAQHRARVSELLAKTGIGTKAARQAGKHEEAQKAARRMLEGGTWDFISFVQTLERIFGADHRLVKRWNEQVRVAQIQKTDSIMAADKELREAMRAAMGGNASPYQIEVRLAEMALNNTVRLEVPEGARQVSKSIPLATARQIADGTAEAADWSLTLAEVQEALAEHDARSDTGKQAVKNLTITTRTAGVPTVTEYTEAQAVTLILFARQERYQVNLENAGFTPGVVKEARAQLSPEALAMADHLAEFYRANYAPLDALFTRMFGVHMPMEDNYSPAAFERSGNADAMAAPGAGQLQPEGGFRNGWSKTRSTHQAEPKLENAFIVFQGHLAVTEHWRAFALLTRELSAVLQHVEIKQAIETLHGKAAVGAVSGWIQALEQNGLQQRKAWGWTDRVFRHLQRNMAVIALCMRFTTLAKNTILPALGTARRIGLFNWLRGFSKLAGGGLNYRAFREADFITRREAAGFSQELRAAAAVMRQEMPTRSRQLAFWGMQRMAVADAASTALGAAISFDYHFRALVKSGMSEDAATREAMAMSEDDVRRTAQPVELAERSLYELSMSPGERFMFMFATDARKDSAALMEATRRAYRDHGARGLLKSAEFRTVAGGAWLTVGFLSNLITGILRDAGDGWDDEWLDEKNWNPLAFLSKIFLGPLSAYPLLNDLLSGFKDSGPLTDIADGGRAVKDLGKALFTLDLPNTASGRELEWLEGKLVDIWRGVGLFYSPAADVAPVINTADQVFDIGKGAVGAIAD